MPTIKVSSKTYDKVLECSNALGCSRADAVDLLIGQGGAATNEGAVAHSNGSKNTEVAKMADDKFCPECLKKDIDAKDAARQNKEAIDKLNAEIQAATAHNAELEEQIAKTHEAPDFNDFIQHCTTCPSHKAELEAYNEKVIKKFVEIMTPATAAELARSKGVDLTPDKIELGPELARRLKT